MIEMSLIERLQAISLFAKIVEMKPKNTTGVYIGGRGVTWGYRTNRRKFPENFVLLWPNK